MYFVKRNVELSMENLVEIHIGHRIKEILDNKGMSVAEFSDKINYHRSNVYRLFDKRTIDITLLIRISKVLDYNFFEEISIVVDDDLK